jgi:hypothetical protein
MEPVKLFPTPVSAGARLRNNRRCNNFLLEECSRPLVKCSRQFPHKIPATEDNVSPSSDLMSGASGRGNIAVGNRVS